MVLQVKSTLGPAPLDLEEFALGRLWRVFRRSDDRQNISAKIRHFSPYTTAGCAVGNPFCS